jgi:hypothetical protein
MHKGINRKLFDEFNDIQKVESPTDENTIVKKETKDTTNEGDITPSFPNRNYETRNRQKSQTEAKQRNPSIKPSLKPRQENSLGELTKKFIQLIKQTDDY